MCFKGSITLTPRFGSLPSKTKSPGHKATSSSAISPVTGFVCEAKREKVNGWRVANARQRDRAGQLTPSAAQSPA